VAAPKKNDKLRETRFNILKYGMFDPMRFIREVFETVIKVYKLVFGTKKVGLP